MARHVYVIPIRHNVDKFPFKSKSLFGCSATKVFLNQKLVLANSSVLNYSQNNKKIVEYVNLTHNAVIKIP